jgi:hypothetical protein
MKPELNPVKILEEMLETSEILIFTIGNFSPFGF